MRSVPSLELGPVLVSLACRIEDAAATIGISRSTLFEYIKDGRIPSRKIGTGAIIRHRDLEALLDATPFSAADEGRPEVHELTAPSQERQPTKQAR